MILEGFRKNKSDGFPRSLKTGQIRSKLVKTGQNWSKLVKTGQNWSKLVKTGENWSNAILKVFLRPVTSSQKS